jgi:dolichyl-phosphate-mannose--protein O-mannosyl transferase
VVLVHRIARRLFRHELTAFLAGMFMAIDGMAIVHSRTALLDQTLMFCTLAAFGAVVLDRDWMAARLSTERMSIWWRPWLIVASVFLALATATKWSGLWFVVGCALLVFFFAGRNRIKAGHTNPWLRAFVQDSLPWLPMVLLIVVGLYLATWGGWLASTDAYSRNWAAEHPGEGWQFLPEALRSLIAYHQAAWNFHVGLTSPHSYSGELGCIQEPCSAEVIPLGNPLIWWAGALAILHQAWRAILHREARATAIVVMFLVGWAPWLLFQQRTVFSFYAIVLIPFIAMALAGSIGTYLSDAEGAREVKSRAFVAGAFVFAIVALSYFYYPLWTGEVISYAYWQAHMWLPTWI